MHALSAVFGVALILFILEEAFETVVLPRRVSRRLRLTRLFYRTTWKAWTRTVCSLFTGKGKESLLSLYGPLSIFVLLSLWAITLITGFGLLYLGFGHVLKGGKGGAAGYIYYSGTTFFTLGLGDVVPSAPVSKALTVLEAGTGFGFLAILISYLPALNQYFYRRETPISVLDAHVGSPPTAEGILDRHIVGGDLDVLHQLLYNWESWSAEVHESHLYYPVLAYFRSQHEYQSWLTALTAILDTCAFLMSGIEGTCKCQAELTFAMAEHTILDLSDLFDCMPRKPGAERLPRAGLAYLRDMLSKKGLKLPEVDVLDKRLKELRARYEPYAESLSGRFYLAVPPWLKMKN
ncbi:MAG: potassium channel family protein [Nitrospiraceae bacterium]|nr:potassium channel family protein [Nitrospiraceae bacterium]